MKEALQENVCNELSIQLYKKYVRLQSERDTF